MKKNKLIQKNFNIIFIGGNTFGQDNPFLNFAKICQSNNIDFTFEKNIDENPYYHPKKYLSI